MEKGKSIKIVPDTSAVIHGKLTKLVKRGELDGAQIIIPQIVMAELQSQASRGLEIGFIGLEEIKKLKALSRKHKIKISFFGKRPSYEDIMLAKSGRIDALIQDVAKKQGAVLLTCDLPQALVAEAEGVKVSYHKAYERAGKLKLERLFTPDTMSVHLKEGVPPLAKRGKPGNFKLVQISKKPISFKELDGIQRAILDAARYEEGAFIELAEHGASVVQIGSMRIAITRPPFSDRLEITAVRPIVKLTLDDYALSSRLKERLSKRAEGILIAGPPGSGKSTFAASMAEFYVSQGKIVKTMERPRDLQVPKAVTQYGPLNGSFAKTADMLLLVRPDYTIFDEIRKSSDFGVFADMRLSGIGMIGVIHATDAVDAVQRFIGRIELGVIPHVIDTIIFIRGGEVEKVYSLSLTVRVPSGMTEADLARPIVEVRDFENGKLEYEIYRYGEQTVVVRAKEKRPVQKLAVERIKEFIPDPNAQIEFIGDNRVLIKVANKVIPKLIGKEGKNIKALEKKLGVTIDVEPMIESLGKEVKPKILETGAYIGLKFKKALSGKQANIYIDSEYLFTATIGRKGDIKVTKESEIGRALLRAIASKREIKVFI